MAVLTKMTRHIRLRDFLTAKLRPHVKGRNLGKVMVEREFNFNGNAHDPDISIVSIDKFPGLNTRLRVKRFVPDVAIEISSPNDRLEATMQKLDRYCRCGTETWLLVIPARRAFFFSDRAELILNENDDFRSDLIPGFSIRFKDLFDRA